METRLEKIKRLVKQPRWQIMFLGALVAVGILWLGWFGRTRYQASQKNVVVDRNALIEACPLVHNDYLTALTTLSGPGGGHCGLDLSNQRWLDMDEGIPLFMSDLRVLLLNNNHIKEIPPMVNRLTNLQLLELRDNVIETVPEEIGELSNLLILDLQGNRLPPDEIERLQKLLPQAQIYH